MSQLERKLENKTAVVGIIGLGYVGLPLAVSFAEAGFHVIGFDMQKEKIDSVGRGESYVGDVSSEGLSRVVASNLLEATSNKSKFQETDAICICVPTPLTKTREPDLSYVIQVSEELSSYIRPDQLIILESTTYPGTTREVVLPILERSKLKGGRDFYLAYSPERVDPNNKQYSIKNTPKLVGGIDPVSTSLAELFYRQVADIVIPVSCPDVAEMTKVFENVFRSVNIALVNELACLCEAMGISVWEVIGAASSKPYGYMPFYPGPGVGGHCIPLDPYYLSSKAKDYDFHVRFIELATDINEQMPYYVTNRIMEALSSRGKNLKGAGVLVLGVAYKKDVDDIRESPALKVIELLAERGAKVSYNDPYLGKSQFLKDTATCVELTRKSLSSADCVVIATDHSSYDYQFIVDNASLVFDTRGVTRAIKGENILRLGE